MSDPMTARSPSCPFCATLLTTNRLVLGPSEAVPEDGDLSLCFSCGEWVVHVATDTGPGLRKPNDEEYVELAEEEPYGRLRAAWVQSRQPPPDDDDSDDDAPPIPTLADRWSDYRDDCLPKLGPKAMQIVRDSFYAGAVSLVGCTYDAADEGDIGLTMQTIRSLRREMLDYARLRKAGRIPK